MIIVYRQASGPIDGTNLFGHVAIAFTEVGGNESFAISWMGANQGSPTYHDSNQFRGPRSEHWKSNLEHRPLNRAFPHVTHRIEIKTQESEKRHGDLKLMSEQAAYAWWHETEKLARLEDSGKRLNFEGTEYAGMDCADAVVAALKKAGSEKIASVKTITRPITTPPAVIQYAKSLRDKSEAYIKRLGPAGAAGAGAAGAAAGAGAGAGAGAAGAGAGGSGSDSE
ncbi:hypothetical protein IWQ51_006222 [Labrenzia sp. EL_142]|nr:hypothetical protein [Labrenzia sp. EL_142]